MAPNYVLLLITHIKKSIPILLLDLIELLGMPDLVDAIKNYVKSPKKHFDTDEVDQLNFFITPLLLFVGCLLIALKQ